MRSMNVSEKSCSFPARECHAGSNFHHLGAQSLLFERSFLKFCHLFIIFSLSSAQCRSFLSISALCLSPSSTGSAPKSDFIPNCHPAYFFSTLFDTKSITAVKYHKVLMFHSFYWWLFTQVPAEYQPILALALPLIR